MAREFGRPPELMQKRIRIKAWSDEPITVEHAVKAFALANPFVNVGARDCPYTEQVQIGTAQVFIMADYAEE